MHIIYVIASSVDKDEGQHETIAKNHYQGSKNVFLLYLNIQKAILFCISLEKFTKIITCTTNLAANLKEEALFTVNFQYLQPYILHKHQNCEVVLDSKSISDKTYMQQPLEEGQNSSIPSKTIRAQRSLGYLYQNFDSSLIRSAQLFTSLKVCFGLCFSFYLPSRENIVNITIITLIFFQRKHREYIYQFKKMAYLQKIFVIFQRVNLNVEKLFVSELLEMIEIRLCHQCNRKIKIYKNHNDSYLLTKNDYEIFSIQFTEYYMKNYNFRSAMPSLFLNLYFQMIAESNFQNYLRNYNKFILNIEQSMIRSLNSKYNSQNHSDNNKKRTPVHIIRSGYTHPPYICLRPVTFTLIIHLIQCVSHMMMTIITLQGYIYQHKL